jgi:hypothetical protein
MARYHRLSPEMILHQSQANKSQNQFLKELQVLYGDD